MGALGLGPVGNVREVWPEAVWTGTVIIDDLERDDVVSDELGKDKGVCDDDEGAGIVKRSEEATGELLEVPTIFGNENHVEEFFDCFVTEGDEEDDGKVDEVFPLEHVFI